MKNKYQDIQNTKANIDPSRDWVTKVFLILREQYVWQPLSVALVPLNIRSIDLD